VKLLVISGVFPPRKVAEADYALHLCNNLAARGIETEVLSTIESSPPGNLSFKVHATMRDWSWRDLPRFSKCLNRFAPDAILVNYVSFIYNYHPMVTFVPTFFKALFQNGIVVTIFHDADGSEPQRCGFGDRGLRKGVTLWAGTHGVDYNFGTLLRDSDHVVVGSVRDKLALVNRFPPLEQKCSLIPPPPSLVISQGENGLARKRGREILRLDSKEFVVAYFGYIRPSKGIEVLLHAFQILRLRGRLLSLILVGGTVDDPMSDGVRYRRDLQKMSIRLGLEDSLRWTGGYCWDSEEASLYLRAADICVLPFDYGAYLAHGSIGVAAIHGLPIITTRPEHGDDSLLDQENVFFCPPRNSELLATAIEVLLENADLRERLGRGAIRLADEWFSWDRATERIIQTFKKEDRLAVGPMPRRLQ
jgi:polysaccharide biosynthesis protein PslF